MVMQQHALIAFLGNLKSPFHFSYPGLCASSLLSSRSFAKSRSMVVPQIYSSTYSCSVQHECLATFFTSTSLLTSNAPTTDFSPVLNVPALICVLFITFVFVFLQTRVTAIGEAVERRTRALEDLRAIKSQELDGVAAEKSDDFKRRVSQAVERYRNAFEEVERIRNIFPGVRIRPPPSPQNRQSKDEIAAAAARQYLGFSDEDNRSRRSNRSNNNIADKDENLSNVPLPLAIILGVIVVTQVGLFAMLLTDPTSSNSVMDTVEALSGLE